MSDVFVNAEKLERAQEIYALVTGTLKPRNSDEEGRLDHYTRIASDAKIDLKDKEKAVKAFYLKLGGLVRTEEEEKKAQEKKKEIQAKGKKDKLGLK